MWSGPCHTSDLKPSLIFTSTLATLSKTHTISGSFICCFFCPNTLPSPVPKTGFLSSQVSTPLTLQDVLPDHFLLAGLTAAMGWTMFPSKFVCWSSDPEYFRNVTLLGDRVLQREEINMRSWKVVSLSNTTGVSSERGNLNTETCTEESDTKT